MASGGTTLQPLPGPARQARAPADRSQSEYHRCCQETDAGRSAREGSHMPDKLTGPANKLLKYTSILLVILGAAAFVLEGTILVALLTEGSAAFVGDLRSSGLPTDAMTTTVAVTASAAVGLLTALLEIWAGRCGLLLRQGSGTSDRCQTLGIVLAGLSAITWLTDRITTGSLGPADFASLVLHIAVPVAFYAAARREERDDFWEGIKEQAVMRPAGARTAARINDRFVLDAVSGMMRPAREGEDPQVELLSLDEYERRENDSAVARHLAHSARSIHHCTASTFEDSVYGSLLIPREDLLASKMPFDSDVALGFNLEKGHLELVSDDADAASFVAFYLENQTLVKHSPATVLFELCDLVVHDDMTYLIDVEDKLDHLEDNMSEDVNEIPQDFTDFVMRTRSDLRVLESFYRQLSDVADSVATSPARVTSEQTTELFRVLSSRTERLAADARNLRDYALQIRSMYQGKIDVRQNKLMSVLTIVSTIFMPLTLLTSWYGMNFEYMPELHNSYAYYAIIAVAVGIATGEVVWFKRKRWF